MNPLEPGGNPISVPDSSWNVRQTNEVGVDVRGDDGLTVRERNRMAREHRAAMTAPFSEAERRALEAAALRRSAALGDVQSAYALCPECGNKRCPRATGSENSCTASNAPGQPGSVYS